MRVGSDGLKWSATSCARNPASVGRAWHYASSMCCISTSLSKSLRVMSAACRNPQQLSSSSSSSSPVFLTSGPSSELGGGGKSQSSLIHSFVTSKQLQDKEAQITLTTTLSLHPYHLDNIDEDLIFFFLVSVTTNTVSIIIQ